MTPSHLASSATCYLAAAALSESTPSIEGVLLAALGSLLPDLDTPVSSVGRCFFPLSGWINRKVGHRTATHSLLGLASFATLLYGSVLLAAATLETKTGSDPVWQLTLGYASHLLIDTLNKTGVALFWPSRRRAVFFFNRRFRITSRGSGDYWFMIICLAANLALYPLARDGFTRSLHTAFADIYSVSMDFRQHGERHRVWLNLEGVEAISNRRISGQFEILATLENASVLIERDGKKQIVSRTAPLHLYPYHSTIEIGDPIRISTVELEMAGRSLGELPSFPKAQRILFFGYLTPVRSTPLPILEDQFNSISIVLDKLKLEYADREDIYAVGLQSTLLKGGHLTAKVIWPAEVTPSAPPDWSETLGPLQVLELKITTGDQLLLQPGDQIYQGDILLQRDLDHEFERAGLDYRRRAAAVKDRLIEVKSQIRLLEAQLEDTQRLGGKLVRLLEATRQRALLRSELITLQSQLSKTAAEANKLTGDLAELDRQKRSQCRRLTELRAEFDLTNSDLQRQARVLATTEGTVERIEFEATASGRVASVFIRK